MIEYPEIGYELSKSGIEVLKARYLFRNNEGDIIEEPKDMFNRVAREIASVEKTIKKRKEWQKKFYDLMASGCFMPNSPTLMNAGRENFSVLSGCFVFDVKDKTYGGIDSIFGAIALMALIHKTGGGTGCSFSKLREENSIVSSTGHAASGPVSFMRNFNEAVEAIQQGGMRRGAHWSGLRVDHPEILKFVECKNELDYATSVVMDKIKKMLNLDKDGEFYRVCKLALVRSQLNNMNISVGLTKKFKEALFNDGLYELISPHTGKVVKKIKASIIFDKICKNAWASGEPGIVDLDEINKCNKSLKSEKIESTNACGEVPMRSYESCILGSIALSRMLKRNGKKYEFSYDKFKNTIHVAVRFLDNLIDAQQYPVKEIERETKQTRKIGLGLMGFADMLIMMGVSYDSDYCLDIIRSIGSIYSKESFNTSSKLAKEKGNFPVWKDSIYSEDNVKMRNAERTAIAPTGSIAGIANVSFSTEPLIYLAYLRTILEGRTFKEVNPVVKQKLKDLGLWNSQIELYTQSNSSLQECELVSKEVKEIFKTANEISFKQHIKVQAEFQQFVDLSISKTINMSADSTIEDVKKAVMLALKLKCKGITIFRDGSRGDQVLSAIKGSKFQTIRRIRERPKKLDGTTYEKEIGECGKLYITINTDDTGYPFEVFVEAGKAGGCLNSQVQAIGRMISIAFRGGLGINEVIKQLRGITCQEAKPSIIQDKSFLSCADAIARTIEEHFKSMENTVNTVIEKEANKGATRKSCSKCGGPIQYEGRCGTCASCFKSTCGG